MAAVGGMQGMAGMMGGMGAAGMPGMAGGMGAAGGADPTKAIQQGVSTRLSMASAGGHSNFMAEVHKMIHELTADLKPMMGAAGGMGAMGGAAGMMGAAGGGAGMQAMPGMMPGMGMNMIG